MEPEAITPPRGGPRARRRLANIALVGLSAVLVAGCPRGSATEDHAENVILISIDTLRPDHLGCYGHERPTSPAIDDLAASGVRFEDVTTSCPWTLPSHMSMLTGMYPSRHGVKNEVSRLRDDVPTLATRLAVRGFQTMGVVNSHFLADRHGLERGFESHSYVDEIIGEPDGSQTIPNRGDDITDQALDLLDQRDGRPFFLFLHYYDVHTDFTPEAEFRAQFVGAYDGPIDGSTQQLVAIRRANAQLPAPDLKHLRDLYDAEIRQLDDQIGRITRYLDQSGLRDNTLVVFTSDHGEEYQEHGSVLHGRTYYQEVIAAPLIMSGPGVAAGVAVPEPVHLVDITPTILALLGLPARDEDDGICLIDHWRDPDEIPKGRVLFAEADWKNEQPDMGRMVRIGPHKLKYDRFTQETELYDLDADPFELVDLSSTEPERLEALMKRIESFMEAERLGVKIPPPTPEEQALLEKLGYTR